MSQTLDKSSEKDPPIDLKADCRTILTLLKPTRRKTLVKLFRGNADLDVKYGFGEGFMTITRILLRSILKMLESEGAFDDQVALAAVEGIFCLMPLLKKQMCLPVAMPRHLLSPTTGDTVGLYDYIVPVVGSVFLRLDPEKFVEAEDLLLTNLLHDDISRVLFSQDVWCILTRANGNLCLQHSKTLISLIQDLPQGKKRRNVEVLLYRFIRMLDDEDAQRVIQGTTQGDPVKLQIWWGLKLIDEDVKMNYLMNTLKKIHIQAFCSSEDFLRVANLISELAKGELKTACPEGMSDILNKYVDFLNFLLQSADQSIRQTAKECHRLVKDIPMNKFKTEVKATKNQLDRFKAICLDDDVRGGMSRMVEEEIVVVKEKPNISSMAQRLLEALETHSTGKELPEVDKEVFIKLQKKLADISGNVITNDSMEFQENAELKGTSEAVVVEGIRVVGSQEENSNPNQP